MSMRYGPVMIDLEGTQLSPAEKMLLAHSAVGGVILFTRNYIGKDALRALVSEIREIKKNILIAVDHEGGRIWRFKEGFTRTPALQQLGSLYEEDQDKAQQASFEAGYTIAKELLSFDIDLSFAPVLDLDTGISTVIGDRSFHHDPERVVVLATAFIQGMNAAGMQATGKHFPGHGGCQQDSHIAQAVDTRTLDILLQKDILPFEKLSSLLGAVMPAHVVYPAVDSMPAGFSKTWLQTILRTKLNFKGAIISDCLSMKAADMNGDFVTSSRMALDAGCDMVILCQQERSYVQRLLDQLERESSLASSERLAKLQGKIIGE